MKKTDLKRYEMILNLLQKNKEEQDAQNDILDQKCSSMINILILIITIQCSILLNVNLFEKIVLNDLIHLIKVLLILTLIINFLSLYLFIKAYYLKDFKGLTSEDDLIRYGENKVILEKIYQEISIDYKKTIDDNRKTIKSKITDMKYGFISILASTSIFIFTIILCLEIII